MVKTNMLSSPNNQNVVFILNGTLNSSPLRPAAKPNILKKVVRKPSVQNTIAEPNTSKENVKNSSTQPPKFARIRVKPFASINPLNHSNEQKRQEDQMSTNIVSVGSSQPYVVDPSTFAALPSEHIEATKTDRNKNNSSDDVVEVVVKKDQVHVLNGSLKSYESDVATTICRTCLNVVPLGECTKLFGEDLEKSELLRKKIAYIIPKIDFGATVDPMICPKCGILFDISFNFKKTVTTVENRVEEKQCTYRNIKLSVNLKHLIKEKPTNEKDIAPTTKSRSDKDNTNEILLEYLAKRDSFITRVLADTSSELPQEPSTPVPIQEIETNIAKETTEPVAANASATVPPIKKPPVTKRVYRPFSAPNFSNIQLVARKNFGTYCGKWSVFDESDPIDEIVEKEIIKEASVIPPDVPPPRIIDITVPFEPERRVRPKVPKTFDLFDQEHDNYFEHWKGFAGRTMVRKWKRFRQRLKSIGDGPFLCSVCGLYFTERLKFKTHLYKHVRNVQLCSHCGGMYKNRAHLMNHMQTHDAPTHTCEFCGKMFHMKKRLSLHMKSVHEKFQCHICGKIMAQLNYARHLEVHKDRLYSCRICHKKFNMQFNLAKHERSHFLGHKCKDCGQWFKSHTTLQRHRQRDHLGIQWQCSICDKFLAAKDRLISHYKSIHGLIKCDVKPVIRAASNQTIKTEEDNGLSARELYENFNINQDQTDSKENSDQPMVGNEEISRKIISDKAISEDYTEEIDQNIGEEEAIDEEYVEEMDEDSLNYYEEGMDENSVEEYYDEGFDQNAVEDFTEEIDQTTAEEDFTEEIDQNTVPEDCTEEIDQNTVPEDYTEEIDQTTVEEDCIEEMDQNTVQEDYTEEEIKVKEGYNEEYIQTSVEEETFEEIDENNVEYIDFETIEDSTVEVVTNETYTDYDENSTNMDLNEGCIEYYINE